MTSEKKKKYTKIKKIYKNLNFNGIHYSNDKNITDYRIAIRKLYTVNHMLDINKMKEDKEKLSISTYQELKNTNLSLQYPILIFYTGALLSFLASSLSSTQEIIFFIIYISFVVGSIIWVLYECVSRNKMLNRIIKFYEMINKLLDEHLNNYK